MKKADLTHVLKKRTHWQSIMALARVSDMSAAKWLSRMFIRFFSGVGMARFILQTDHPSRTSLGKER